MDKRSVIAAYRCGMITMQECAQILGIDSVKLMGLVHEPVWAEVKTAAVTAAVRKPSILRR